MRFFNTEGPPRRRAIAAAAGVLLGAALVVTPWAVRGAADSTTYASATLVLRAVQRRGPRPPIVA